jgi:hypothetical protein
MTVELVRAQRHWYDNRERLADLADWLKEQGREPNDYGYFFRKPWKWQGEYDEMCREEAQERYADEQESREDRYAL